MTPNELAKVCAEAINRGQETVTFTLPEELSDGENVYLAGMKGGPKGTVLCVNYKQETVASFDAMDILAWLMAKGLVKGKMKFYAKGSEVEI